MSPDQQHRCTVQQPPGGRPYLAFEPSSGEPSSYSNSLFTLDLKDGTSLQEAQALAEQINRVLRGVSATVF
jgi:hypothetical protein